MRVEGHQITESLHGEFATALEKVTTAYVEFSMSALGAMTGRSKPCFRWLMNFRSWPSLCKNAKSRVPVVNAICILIGT